MTTLTCPKCGPALKLVGFWRVKGPGDSEQCMICPRCGYHEPVPVDRQLADSGAARLPGL